MSRSASIGPVVSTNVVCDDLLRQLGGQRLSRRGLLRAAAGGAAIPALAGLASRPGAAVAQDGQIAIFVSLVDIPNIDPAVGHDGAISVSQKTLYDTLYRHVGNPIELIPWLATGHEVNADATQWTFTLAEGAKFQDGSPVTADAVVYSLRRLLQVNKGVAFMFKGVVQESGIEVVDPLTVRFTLDKPFGPFLHATTWLFVLNPAVVQEHDNGDLGQEWLVSNAAGSGPFKIGRWEPGNLYQFDADPNYWRGWEDPHLDAYIHQVSQESSSKRIALEEGEAHMAAWLSPEDKIRLEQTAGIVVPKEPGISTYTIKMNTKRGPTADVHVRRAISYAFDYNGMIEVMSGFATRINGPLASSVPMARQGAPVYETDIEKAKAELAMAAPEWQDGFEIEFAYVTGLEEERKTGLILLDQLSKLNITVKITAMEWVNAVALFAEPDQSPEMFPIFSGSDFPDPDNFLWQSFHSSSAGTWTGANHYSNPEVDKLLEDARSTSDEAARTALYDHAQQILIDEAVEVYLFTPLEGQPYREEIQGYVPSPVMGSDPNWYDISLKA